MNTLPEPIQQAVNFIDAVLAKATATRQEHLHANQLLFELAEQAAKAQSLKEQKLKAELPGQNPANQ